MTPSLLPAAEPDAQHMLDPSSMSVVWFACRGRCCLSCSFVPQTQQSDRHQRQLSQGPSFRRVLKAHCGEAVNPWWHSMQAITRLRKVSCLLLPSISSLLTDPIPFVPLVPEIAQALLKDKSRMGAEVRNVSVWCAICAKCLCHRACITTSHSISCCRGGTAMFHASCGACLILLATYHAVSGRSARL